MLDEYHVGDHKQCADMIHRLEAELTAMTKQVTCLVCGEPMSVINNKASEPLYYTCLSRAASCSDPAVFEVAEAVALAKLQQRPAELEAELTAMRERAEAAEAVIKNTLDGLQSRLDDVDTCGYIEGRYGDDRAFADGEASEARRAVTMACKIKEGGA